MSETAERQELWGGETPKAVANFPVSGEPIPVAVAHWLGRIKAAAARVNAELGLLDADMARADRRGRRPRSRPASSTTSSRSTSSRPARDELEHERERGDRDARRRGRPRERPREHGPVVERRLPLGGAPRRARRASCDDLLPALEQLAARARGEGGGVRRRRQVGADAPDGRRAGHARPGVLRATPPRCGRASRASRTRCRASARSRSAARRRAPASTPTPSSRRGCARSCTRQPGFRSRRPPTRSRRRRRATGSSRPRARSRSSPSR